MDKDQVYEDVQKHYSSEAKATDADYSKKVAKAFGYSESELTSIPADANLGLSCGNPLALANLKEGETVIDFGSGAGFDVFLAAKHVGSTGKVIGVDMNKAMLERANANKEAAKADNVSFIESRITDVRLPDATADCIISNCVVNLVPEAEKQLVFNEMFRLLKPGGRVAISDILAKKQLPPEIRNDMALYVGCVAGASQVVDYQQYFRTAGFKDCVLVDTNSDLNIYTSAKGDGKESSCCSSSANSCIPRNSGIKNINFNEWAGSFKIYAVKS
ncbi:S-adenosylmethionine-dependent methyltransferase [Emydomyces testavorans]|uniref:Arsenite methyltransferase n=1 Tax=Emydomyces testavorans TaxID=2070801 RepID=A0AAF0DKH2_9EURO|nr:S-adenosylmethionine-dependent methyltransferase [Emydomyces testavorans]